MLACEGHVSDTISAFYSSVRDRVVNTLQGQLFGGGLLAIGDVDIIDNPKIRLSQEEP